MAGSVIAVNHYALRDPQGFRAAVTALAARVRAEGDPGVELYQFHLPAADQGRAVVVYRDAQAWVGHHDRITGWPELAALRAAADLAEVQLYGPVTPAMTARIARMGIADRVRFQGAAVAGFRRPDGL